MIFFRAGKGAALEELSEKSTDEVITMLTSNEAFMEKVQDYQRRRAAIIRTQAMFRQRREQLWLKKAVAVRRVLVYQEEKRKVVMPPLPPSRPPAALRVATCLHVASISPSLTPHPSSPLTPPHASSCPLS